MAGITEAKATFFVAKDGNDAWSGKLAEPNAEKTEGPFATLARARDAVRELSAHGLENPVTVMVRGGKYYLEETLVLGSEDSGTQDFPITYTAYPGEKPILSGGRKIIGFSPYKGKILQCELPEAKGDKWKFRQLFFNGKRQIRARTPNFDPENPLYGGWAFMEGPAEEGSLTAFKHKPGAFKHHWAKPTQGEVNVVPGVCGLNGIIPIKAVDEKTRVITLTHSTINPPLPGLHPEPLTPPIASWWGVFYPVCGAFRPGNRFYVENLLEELDQPGEWCLDTEEGIVYFLPPTESIEGAEVVAPALDCLIDLRGASWIKISGFTFTETTGGDNFHHGGGHGYGPMFPTQGLKYCGDSVHLKGAEHCVIENNNFYAVGGNGVYLEGYNARNLIRHNEISHAGACGVSLLGSKEEHPLYNEVEDNHIHHTGVYNKFSAGVFLGLSEGNFISHNLIEHVPNHAINLGSNGFGRNFVEYNEIRYACQETHDNGAINSWMEGDRNELTRDAERSGHIIRYNFIADTPGEAYLRAATLWVSQVPGSSYRANGIYLDNYTSNCLVYGNIVVRVAGAGIVVHSGKNHVIENNILVDNGSQIAYAESWAPLGPGFITSHCFQRNILYYTDPKAFVFYLAAWTDRVVAKSDYNLFFNAGGPKYAIAGQEQITSLEQWKGYDAHSVIADPLFVDPEHDDYRLKPESPALKLGFVPIDVTKIGMRGEEQK